MKIYLGGPINNCTDAECMGWRTAARSLLTGHEIIDPMARDYRGREDEAVVEIVEGDKADIDRADVLLMNCTRPSVGTSMEVLYGWQLDKRVLVIAAGRVSPWLRYHSEVFSTLEMACESLR